MSATPVNPHRLRILIACARPIAARLLKLQITFRSSNTSPDKDAIASVISLLREKLKLAVIGSNVDGNAVTLHLPTPLPELRYLENEVRHCAGILNVSPTYDVTPVDVHQPGEELQAVLNGLRTLGKSVEIAVLDPVKPQDLREHLDATPGYDVLYLACHGNEYGALLLEDGRGWARYVGPRELAALGVDKVTILLLGACHGERALSELLRSQERQRPPVIVFAQGEHVIPSRAVHVFTEGFYRSLVEGQARCTATCRSYPQSPGYRGWREGQRPHR